MRSHPVTDDTVTPEARALLLLARNEYEPDDAELNEVSLGALRAALAATSSPEPGLDVERLARALHVVFNHGYHGGGWDNGDGDLAGAVAAEYARLASEDKQRA
jgi:hypothetical protein